MDVILFVISKLDLNVWLAVRPLVALSNNHLLVLQNKDMRRRVLPLLPEQEKHDSRSL